MKSIIALAASPLKCPTSLTEDGGAISDRVGSSLDQQLSSQRLAVAREGGRVELLCPQERWISVGDVPGVRGREIDALVWVCGNRGESSDASLHVSKEQESIGRKEDEAGPLNAVDLGMHTKRVDERQRLFGCSRDGTIFELDFATKRQMGVIGSGGGGVFCMTSLCTRGKCCGFQRRSKNCPGYFAAGLEDGTVKIFRSFDSEGNACAVPELVATLPSAGNAILSLAWIPGQSTNDKGVMKGSVIFAGVADGTIRRFDCVTSIVNGPISTGAVLSSSATTSYRWTSTLRMTVENRGLREATKVWALEALSDGTVVSGDSLGHVQIWDGMSGTMSQTFDHNESGADVICLAVSDDENKIFASGVDSRILSIQRQRSHTDDGSPKSVRFDSSPMRKWINSYAHRQHSHDVLALAICHKVVSNKSKPLELLVSGSVDTRLCTYLCNDFRGRPKIWYNWPSLSPISISSKRRLLSVMRDDKIDLYRLENSTSVFPFMRAGDRDHTKCQVKTISIESPFNLTCSSISNDSKFLAASDATSLYVFSLQVEHEDEIITDVHPTKLVLPKECMHSCTALRFDDQGRLICATVDGLINVLKLSLVEGSKNSVEVTLDHVFREHTIGFSLKAQHFPVVKLEVSPDGKYLAAGRFSCGKGSVHVFTLPLSEDDRYHHWWSVPETEALISCIKFLGGGSVASSLVVGCSNNAFYIFNLIRRSLSHWSEDMGLPILSSLPHEFSLRSEPVVRIIANPTNPQKFILGSHGFFCTVDLDQPVPEISNVFPPNHLRSNKRKPLKEEDSAMLDSPLPPEGPKSHANPSGTVTNKNFTICLKYSGILFQDFISENEMVVVEQPWMSVLDQLPDALARRIYGA